MKKTYSEMIQYADFLDRIKYLQVHGQVGIETFGFDRYLNQALYKSKEWLQVRNQVIMRDNGCDLAHPEYTIYGRLIIHHIEPLTEEDILERSPKVFDLDNLVCCSIATHNAIHYVSEDLSIFAPVERRPNDTCPWK